MKISQTTLKQRLSAILLGLVFALPALVAPLSAQGAIAQSPLFLTVPVNPNLILAIDDSGSMDSEVLMPANDGAMWWNTDDKSFVGRDNNDEPAAGVINFNNAGGANSTWKKYTYLFPNGTGLTDGRRAYADSTNDHYAIAPLPRFAYTRSPAFNPAYFNPTESYTPWPDLGGFTFNDASPTAAKTDPVYGAVTMDLTADIQEQAVNWIFRMQPGMVIPEGTVGCIKPSDPSQSCTFAPFASDTLLTAEESVAITYFPAAFYLPSDATLPGEYASYTGDTTLTGYSPGASTPDLVRYEIKPENFSSAGDYSTAIQNFANWFTYYRKRHLATRGGIAKSFETTTRMNAGMFRINNRVDVTMQDLTVSTEKDAFFDSVYRAINAGGTPNREALNHAGLQFKRTDSGAPITFACQQNFTALFTDGFSNPSSVTGIGNEDGDNGSPFADSVSGTIADIAMLYYENHLRDDLDTGRVITQQGCAATNPDPWLDCNANLHMTTFGVLLGNRGEIYLQDAAATEDPYSNPPAWPTTFPARHPSAVDDLWHATINSRGEMLNARTPSEISSKFQNVLGNIASRVSSAAAVATNSTRLDTDTVIYQARFDSTDWIGQLLAFSIIADGPDQGDVGGMVWDSGQELEQLISSGTHTARDIYTWRPDLNDGATFSAATLSATQLAALDTDPDTGVVDGLAADRLNYLRGDHGKEIRNGGPFRNRRLALGDIINSDPFFVAKPDFRFNQLIFNSDDETEGLSYTDFRNSEPYLSRKSVVYIGGNDGMLHAFEAETGQEMFAYIPNAVFSNLNRLTSPNYNTNHRFFVDGSPRVVDAYFGSGDWRSVLVGGLGAGGKGIFALDVTDPGSFAAGDVLWEFTDANDADLGHTFSQPTIARMHDGNWYVLVGNGYGSASGKAVLYFIDVQTGALAGKQKLTLHSGPGNGLSSVIPVDTNGDRITDLVYAGDLLGNMWKIDVTNSNSGNWDSAFKSGTTPVSLFTATDTDTGAAQPITHRPEVGAHPNGGYMALFGTGKYYEDGDNQVGATPQVQTFYGIYDTGAQVTRGQLVEQTIEFEGPAFDVQIRLISANAVDYDGGTHKGWFLDLESPVNGAEGERVVATPLLRDDRIIFTTLIPSSPDDPCSFGGTGWLMELDATSGKRLNETVYDLNNDGVFDENDFAQFDSDGDGVLDSNVAVSGRRSEVGIIKTPGIISAGSREFKYLSGSSGVIESVTEAGSDITGRKSWRQIR